MVLPTAAFPPELLTHVFDFSVPNPYTDAQATELSREHKQIMANCSLVSRRWAQQCRPRMFKSLRLRSMADLQTLQALDTAIPPTSMRPIGQYVQCLILEAMLGVSAWFGDGTRNFLDFGRSRIKGTHTFLQVWLTVIPPTSALVLKEDTLSGFLYWYLPRTLPSYYQIYDQLLLQTVQFRCLENASVLGKEVSQATPVVNLENFAWILADQPSPSRNPKTFFIPCETNLTMNVSECSDIAWLSWWGFGYAAMALGKTRGDGVCQGMLLLAADIQALTSLSRTLYETAKSAQLCDTLALNIRGSYCRADGFVKYDPLGVRPHSGSHHVCSLRLLNNSNSTLLGPVFEFYTRSKHRYSRFVDADVVRVHSILVTIPVVSIPVTDARSLSSGTGFDWEAVVAIMLSFPELQHVVFHFPNDALLIQFMNAQKSALTAILTMSEFWYLDSYSGSLKRVDIDCFKSNKTTGVDDLNPRSLDSDEGH